jgi:preprotein translocase subunit SecE
MDFIWNNIGKIIAAIALVACAALVLKYHQVIRKFLMEVRVELGKVAWSTREELFASTIVVIVTTSIMAAYLFIIDGALTRFLSWLFK